MKKILTGLLVFRLCLTPCLSRENKDNNEHVTSFPVEVSDVKITGGFWAERMQINNQVSIPYLRSIAEDPEKGHVVRNFEIAAGIKEGKREGTNWQDAWLYKWIEAASYAQAEHFDPQREAEIDSLIHIIVLTQADDGYLATQTMITDLDRFERPNVHEFYTMGHLLTAASVHYKLTGKPQLLEVAEKCAHYLYHTVAGKEKQFAEFPYNPSVIMGAVDLYRVTHKEEYLKLASFFVYLRGSGYAADKSRPFWATDILTRASDQNQNYKPLVIEDEVLGHAVFFTYLYSGAADVYMETGDPALLTALDRLWTDLVTTKMYITGGIGPEHKALVTRKRGDHQRDIVMGDPIHEGIAGPYRLPNSTAYNETCGQVGDFMWNWRMLRITGEEKYAGIMERSIYNSILSGVELDGTGWFYTNPLTWNGKDHVLLNHDSHKRFDPGLDNICCPTNLTRTVASWPGYLYTVSEGTLWLNLFAENELSTTVSGYGDLSLNQKTDYPWDGKIILSFTKVQPGKNLALKIRIPEWAERAEIYTTAENAPVSGKPGTYLTLRHEWKKGDRITMNFHMDVKLVRANPSFENLTNQVAVQRGPIVYCLESLDIRGRVPIDNIYIPSGAQWQIEKAEGPLNGIMTISTNAKALKNDPDTPEAYYLLRDPELTDVKISMIPYFAWNNREEPKMRVWLPVLL